MMSKFNKNGVLTGYVESFCLVCQTAFQSSDDASEHIELTMHLENLNNYPYLDKYKDDHIRKVDSGYFCEFCNVLEPTAAKIVLHIADTKHSYAKNSQMLTLRGGNVQYGNILLSNEAWNGLKEDSCMICNIESDNISVHKTEKDHLLKLVQSKIEFGENGSLYRKVDSDTFQCLTCNSMLKSKAKTNHFEYSEHTKLYDESKIKITNIVKSNEHNEKENMKNDISENHNKIAKPIAKFLSDHKLNDDLLSKVDGNGQNIKYNDSPMSKDTVALKQDLSVSYVEEAQLLATENKLIYKTDSNNVYCKICKNRFPSSLRSMKEHVNGKVHQKNISLDDSKPKYTVELTRRYLEELVDIYYENSDDEIVVNDKFMMKEKSFQLMAIFAGQYRCYVCEVNVQPNDFSAHVVSYTHNKFILAIPIVTSFNKEFVREVGPGVFHCGFCDVIVSSWSELECHLESSQHETWKSYFEFQLYISRPKMDMYRRENYASKSFNSMRPISMHSIVYTFIFLYYTIYVLYSWWHGDK